MNYTTGIKIKKIRELKNFSQQYLADKLSIRQGSYSDLETGKREISTEMLKEIAKILDVSPETIENFSEQVVFNSCTQAGMYNSNTYHAYPEKMIAHLEKQVCYLQEQNERLLKLLESKTVI